MPWMIPSNARSPLADKQKGNGDAYPCAICGINAPNPRYMVHLHGGGSYLVTEEEAKTMDPAGDMYCYPIGPNCFKKYPELRNGYVFDAKKDGIIMGDKILPAGHPFK